MSDQELVDLSELDPEPNRRVNPPQPSLSDQGECPSSSGEVVRFNMCQWSAEFNDKFRPAGPSVATLPAGVYRFANDQRGLYAAKKHLVTDELIELEDSSNKRALQAIRAFWAAKERYRAHGILHKYGLFLYGPPGGGKTVTVELTCRDLVAHNGVVTLCDKPSICVEGLGVLRRIEPDRPLIVVYEDIDELIDRYGEYELLGLLDGEDQVANVVNIATCNYPERLGGRVVNRPKRFDERMFIGMPSFEAREQYLRRLSQGEQLSERELGRWVEETEGLSVAHLGELVAAVFCRGQDYESVIKRLKRMRVKLKSKDEFCREVGVI